MDSFERVVSEILWRLGYWTQTEFRVELSKAEKRAIGRVSSPRWEIDVIAYSGAKRELLVVECKSYLDYSGVKVSSFDAAKKTAPDRFKLFNEPKTRRIVFRALIRQLETAGHCPGNLKLRLCLAAGKIRKSDQISLERLFKRKGWTLWDGKWLKDELIKLSKGGYENQISAVVSKLLLRGEAGK